MDIDMKIQTSFVDDECAIVFSFYFTSQARKIGQAVVYTAEKIGDIRLNNSGKTAYLKEFSICEEYIQISQNMINHFLKTIGIESKFIAFL